MRRLSQVRWPECKMTCPNCKEVFLNDLPTNGVVMCPNVTCAGWALEDDDMTALRRDFFHKNPITASAAVPTDKADTLPAIREAVPETPADSPPGSRTGAPPAGP